MTKVWRRFAAIFMILSLIYCVQPQVALADDWYGDDEGYYTVQDSSGHILFAFAGEVSVDDEYISGDNKLYRVVEVDSASRRAVARFVEDVTLPEDEAADVAAAAPANSGKRVALYCTHTDESYVPGDGAANKEGKGGIVDVASKLKDDLEKKGIQVDFDATNHTPHDAGAYRRSRPTAVRLMQNDQPDLMIDVHRDGVPDPSEYKDKINGQDVSKVRLVVGRGNQNRDANKDLALRIKKVADEKYPGYVKDIYMGKGSYNQDIMPRAILLEVGTHTTDKKDVMVSMDYMSEVISGVLGAQPQAQAQPNQANPNQAPAQQSQQNNTTRGENRTGFRSTGWIIGIVAVVLVAFLLILTRSGHRKEKAGNFMREITGTNRRPPEDKNK